MSSEDVIFAAMEQFVQQPSEKSYREVYDLLCSSSCYSPDCNDVHEMERLLGDAKYDELKKKFQASVPNLILNVRANMLMSFALKQSGKSEASEGGVGVSQTICFGIACTGDGTSARPYLITHDNCASAFLSLHCQTGVKRQRFEKPDGKVRLIAECENGKEIWFDVAAQYKEAPAELPASIADSPLYQIEQIEAAMEAMLPNPTEENYRRVFEMLRNSSYYDPQSKAINEMVAALNAENYKKVENVYKDSNPNFILNPYAATLYAMALKAMNEDDTATTFLMASVTICKAMRTTGDGSRERPILITHASAARGYLEFDLEKEIASSKTIEVSGRTLLQASCTDGTVCWFDLTESARHKPKKQAVDRIATKPPAGPPVKRAQDAMMTGCIGSTLFICVSMFALGSNWFAKQFGGMAQIAGFVVVLAVAVAFPYVYARSRAGK